MHIECTLSSIQVEKTDETIQLRAHGHLQGKKTPHNTPPPRRGTRASLDPVRNSGTRTIQIPLDPIPVTGAPRTESTPKPKAKLTATPVFAQLLGTDLDTLTGLIDKLEGLLVGDDVTVNVEKTKNQIVKKTTAKTSEKLAKPLTNY